MKQFKRVLAVVLTAVLLLSVAGCTPVSFTKQYSHKYSDDTLSTQTDIGVYIYAMYQAYNSAASYASKNEDYVEGEDFTDLEITDDDGNTAIASEWIKTEADKIVADLIAIDYLCAEQGVKLSETVKANAENEAKENWEMGPYASYGYYYPYKDMLEPYGVSIESFTFATSIANAKMTELFSSIYDIGGTQEVSNKELTKFFKENYVSYSYIPVQMYNSQNDEEGNTTTVAYSKKKIADIKSTLEGYAEEITNGTLKFEDATKNAVKDLKIADGDAVTSVKTKEDLESDNKDIATALGELNNGEAKVITVGDKGESPMAYLVVKYDINDSVKEYIEGENNRTSVLSKLKYDEFNDLIDKKTDEILKSDNFVSNKKVIKRYKANLFFEEPEETEPSEDEASEE